MEQPRPGNPGRAAPGLPGHRGRPGGPLTGRLDRERPGAAGESGSSGTLQGAQTSTVPVSTVLSGHLVDELAGLGPFFAVDAHPPGAEAAPPWRPLRELLGPSPLLLDRIDAARAALAARGGQAVSAVEPRVAAAAVHLGLAARLTSPALGAAVLGYPLDLRPDRVWGQAGTGGPVPLSVPEPGGGPGPAPGEWERVLHDELLAPLTAAIACLVPLSRRVLWGNVASAVNAAARQVVRQRPELAADTWQAAGRLRARPSLRTERNPPGPAFRRSSCCLFYRLAPGEPSAVCGDCVLTARAARSPRRES